MTWSRSKPPKFIDVKKISTLIRETAKAQMQTLSDTRPYIEQPQVVLAELSNLVSAAREANQGPTKNDEELRGVLFDAEALELLALKCRNRYWMWYLLSFVETSQYSLDKLAIARAHARAKDSLYDNRFGFAFVNPNGIYHEMKSLPLGFVLEMWDKGRILASRREDANGYSVILNPILVDD